jgi:hypothetical protein
MKEVTQTMEYTYQVPPPPELFGAAVAVEVDDVFAVLPFAA